ncbi:hypothetical protein EW146_g10140, partial [Bondarzewia mesenterica]
MLSLTEKMLPQPSSFSKKKQYELHGVLGTGTFGKVVRATWHVPPEQMNVAFRGAAATLHPSPSSSSSSSSQTLNHPSTISSVPSSPKSMFDKLTPFTAIPYSIPIRSFIIQPIPGEPDSLLDEPSISISSTAFVVIVSVANIGRGTITGSSSLSPSSPPTSIRSSPLLAGGIPLSTTTLIAPSITMFIAPSTTSLIAPSLTSFMSISAASSASVSKPTSVNSATSQISSSSPIPSASLTAPTAAPTVPLESFSSHHSRIGWIVGGTLIAMLLLLLLGLCLYIRKRRTTVARSHADIESRKIRTRRPSNFRPMTAVFLAMSRTRPVSIHPFMEISTPAESANVTFDLRAERRLSGSTIVPPESHDNRRDSSFARSQEFMNKVGRTLDGWRQLAQARRQANTGDA